MNLTTQRIGLWFGPGLEHALAARAALGELQREYPGADWVLFGPRGSLFLFEMDERVQVYISLRSAEPRRPAQSRLSYFLEKRAQFKKLRSLGLNLCIGVAVLSQAENGAALNRQAAEEFKQVQRMLGVSGRFLQNEESVFHQISAPVLEAGPQALAFATNHHRSVSPNQTKLLVVIEGSEFDAQWKQAQAAASGFHSASMTVAAIVAGDRLLARRLAQSHPDWLQVDLAQAMGLIAYADRVICSSPAITRICSEMGRTDRLLLGKSHS